MHGLSYKVGSSTHRCDFDAKYNSKHSFLQVTLILVDFGCISAKKMKNFVFHFVLRSICTNFVAQMTQLDQIRAALAADMQRLNDIIRDTLLSDSVLMNSIVSRYLATKGKQLRPMLTLLSGRLFGQVNQRVLHAGAAIEILHNATLIHDDVIDQAQQRRGAPTINSVWDNHVAVLVGDYFVTGALRCAVKAQDTRVLEALCSMGGDLSLGEINQFDNARNRSIDEQTYFKIIGKKTASLFETCVAVAGYVNNAPQQQIEALSHYARLLGLAFQIKDDTFDYYDANVGKPTGNDLREGKVTLPLIYALSRTDLPEQQDMCSLAQKQQLDTHDIDTLVDYAKRAGGIEYAHRTMQRLRHEADALLDSFTPCDTIQWLRSIFCYIIERDI